jgi:hypothetical protein
VISTDTNLVYTWIRTLVYYSGWHWYIHKAHT